MKIFFFFIGLSLLILQTGCLTAESKHPLGPLGQLAQPSLSVASNIDCRIRFSSDSVRKTELGTDPVSVFVETSGKVDSMAVNGSLVSDIHAIQNTFGYLGLVTLLTPEDGRFEAVISRQGVSHRCANQVNIVAESGPACRLNFDSNVLNLEVSSSVESYVFNFGQSASLGYAVDGSNFISMPFAYDSSSVTINDTFTFDVGNSSGYVVSVDLNDSYLGRCQFTIP